MAEREQQIAALPGLVADLQTQEAEYEAMVPPTSFAAKIVHSLSLGLLEIVHFIPANIFFFSRNGIHST